jgi:hypothetical protein
MQAKLQLHEVHTHTQLTENHISSLVADKHRHTQKQKRKKKKKPTKETHRERCTCTCICVQERWLLWVALLLREGRFESLFIQDTVGKRGKQGGTEKERERAWEEEVVQKPV